MGDHPADPASVSEAPAGDIADEPGENGISVTIAEDERGEVVGMAIRWGRGEWFWANNDSFRSLEDAR